MKTIHSLTKYRGTSCLNCEHPLDVSDKYCPNCGQLNSTKKLSFTDFSREFFGNFFAYDSRFRRTLSAMMFHPGKISKDYIQGKRERYTNPSDCLKTFLFLHNFVDYFFGIVSFFLALWVFSCQSRLTNPF